MTWLEDGWSGSLCAVAGTSYVFIFFFHTNFATGFRPDTATLSNVILLTCKIWWASNNDSRWQMEYNSLFEGLMFAGVGRFSEVQSGRKVKLSTSSLSSLKIRIYGAVPPHMHICSRRGVRLRKGALFLYLCLNILEPELFFLILAQPVYKMWVI